MTAEYEWRTSEYGDPVECDGCDVPAPVRDFDLPPYLRVGEATARTLCEFCANTTGWDFGNSSDVRTIVHDQNAALNVFLRRLTSLTPSDSNQEVGE